jgi:DNA-binding response OmpR family regulator
MTALGSYRTVLLLDEDDAARSNCEQVLSSVGYRVVSLDGGCMDLDRMMEAKPVAVIADLKGPCDDWLRLIREIRERDRDIAIVAIVARATVRDAVDALKAGADEILPERFSIDELKAAVAVALRQHGHRSC